MSPDTPTVPEAPVLGTDDARSLWATKRYACNVVDAAALDRGPRLGVSARKP